MAIYDISGVIREGIWRYSDTYPDYREEHTSNAPDSCFFEIFHGFHSQTGTYLETTAHNNGYDKTRLLIDVPVSALVDVPCRVLHLDFDETENNGGKITAAMLEKASVGMDFPRDCAILFESGWDDWYSPDFLEKTHYLSRDAMEWIIAKAPSIVGSDTAVWQKDESVFDLFTVTDMLLLAPLVGLDRVPGKNGRLTVLPVRVEGTCCAPARAVIIE